MYVIKNLTLCVNKQTVLGAFKKNNNKNKNIILRYVGGRGDFFFTKSSHRGKYEIPFSLQKQDSHWTNMIFQVEKTLNTL